MNWSFIMIQLNQAQEKFKKHLFKKENIIDYLLAGGWEIITLWECDLKPALVEKTLNTLLKKRS